MEEVQSMLRALEKGNTSVFKEDRTLVLPHDVFYDTVMKLLNGYKEV